MSHTNKKIIVIDNYDSFTYNLVELLKQASAEVKVILNDDPEWNTLFEDEIDGIVFSPGPGKPINAGNSFKILTKFAGKKPVLGVCLGHQLIGEYFGLFIIPARELFHGKVSEILHDGKGVYSGIKEKFTAMRYHSLAVSEPPLESNLIVTARTKDGEIMGLRHKSLQIEGVQFHPDSIETERGQQIINNWVSIL